MTYPEQCFPGPAELVLVMCTVCVPRVSYVLSGSSLPCSHQALRFQSHLKLSWHKNSGIEKYFYYIIKAKEGYCISTGFGGSYNQLLGITWSTFGVREIIMFLAICSHAEVV